MSVFGIGGWELLMILLIMLIVAGPRRMLNWAYYLGKYIAKFRKMWEEVVDVLQAELDDAGVDVKLPKDVPTRQNLNKWASDAMKPVSDSLKETVDDLGELDRDIKQSSKLTPTAPKPATQSEPKTSNGPTAEKKETGLGTWSGKQEEPDQEQVK